MEHKYIDLSLPSGTLWADENEEGYFDFDNANDTFGSNLPSKDDWEELLSNTWHRWDDEHGGMWFVSKKDSQQEIFLPAAGYRRLGASYMSNVLTGGYYWSSTYSSSDNAYYVYFHAGYLYPPYYTYRNFGYSVRLIKHNK